MIRGLFKTDVVTLPPQATLQEAARLMRDRDVCEVVVIENRRAIGLVSLRALVVDGLADANSDPRTKCVSDVMEKELVFVNDDAGLDATLSAMKTDELEHVLVVNKRQGLLGILSLPTVIEKLSEGLKDFSWLRYARQEALSEGILAARGRDLLHH